MNRIAVHADRCNALEEIDAGRLWRFLLVVVFLLRDVELSKILRKGSGLLLVLKKAGLRRLHGSIALPGSFCSCAGHRGLLRRGDLRRRGLRRCFLRRSLCLLQRLRRFLDRLLPGAGFGFCHFGTLRLFGERGLWCRLLLLFLIGGRVQERVVRGAAEKADAASLLFFRTGLSLPSPLEAVPGFLLFLKGRLFLLFSGIDIGSTVVLLFLFLLVLKLLRVVPSVLLFLPAEADSLRPCPLCPLPQNQKEGLLGEDHRAEGQYEDDDEHRPRDADEVIQKVAEAPRKDPAAPLVRGAQAVEICEVIGGHGGKVPAGKFCDDADGEKDGEGSAQEFRCLLLVPAELVVEDGSKHKEREDIGRCAAEAEHHARKEVPDGAEDPKAGQKQKDGQRKGADDEEILAHHLIVGCLFLFVSPAGGAASCGSAPCPAACCAAAGPGAPFGRGRGGSGSLPGGSCASS